MEKVCRICLNTRYKNFVPLLKTALNSNELEIEGEKFEYCLGLKVLEIRNYSGICTFCEARLNDFYTFKQQAIKSHYELLGLTSNGNDFESDERKEKSESFSDLDDFENIEYDNDTFLFETMSEVITQSDDEFLDNSSTKKKEFGKIKIEKIDKTDRFLLEVFADDNTNSSTEHDPIVSQNAEEVLSSTMFNDNFDVDSDYDNDDNDSSTIIPNPLRENEEHETNNDFELTEKTTKPEKGVQINGSILRKLLEQPLKHPLKSAEHISQMHRDEDEELPESSPRQLNKNRKRGKCRVTSQTKINLDKKRLEYICDFCNDKFYSKQRFEAHMNEHKGLPAYQCNICGKTYSYICRKYYNYHMKDHQGLPRSHSCELCPRTFHRRVELKNHLRRIHMNEKRFVCEICGKQFNQKAHLEIHSDTHSEGSKYKCDICHKAFRTSRTMQVHRKEIHLPKPFTCKFCNKKFGRKCYYQEHLVRHRRNLQGKESQSNEGPFVCLACGKEFGDIDALKAHETEKHLQKIKHITCKECGKTYTCNLYYQRHIPNCGIKKRTINNTNQTEYICKICGEEFNVRLRYLQHLEKSHNLKCDICLKTYSAIYTLTQHFREMHLPKRFSCDKCNMKFGRKIYCELHMKKFHQDEELETPINDN